MAGRKAKPILITGSHRSGSTWVGKVLAAHPHVGYIHEPFNILQRPGVCGPVFQYWFHYVSEEIEHNCLPALRRTLSFQFRLGAALRSSRTTWERLDAIRQYCRWRAWRRKGRRPLVKDPLALLSAQWLARRFDMSVIVLIRHPAAFAGSLKKAGWEHPFGHFLQQPMLMRDHLGRYETEFRDLAASPRPILDQAILLWNVLHGRIREYRESQPDWLFVRYEDVAAQPQKLFRQMCEYAGLEFCDPVARSVAYHCSADNPVETDRPHEVVRNSHANIKAWAGRLSDAEVRTVKEKTMETWKAFYTEQDWSV